MAKVLKNFILNTFLGKGGNLISRSDHYSAMKRLLAKQPVTGFLDAGASDGRITRKLLRAFPEATAYLFEPHPNYVDALGHYSNSDSRVRPQLMALSDEEGELSLISSEQIGMTSIFGTNRRSANLFPEGEENRKTIEVPVTTIDAWRKKNGDPAIQLMKFDIQAAELKALRGATETLPEILLIYIEVFFNPLYEGGALFSDIDQLLRKFGFILYNIYKPKSDPSDMLMWANAIYLNGNKFQERT